ncbi:MAG: hypothetical protein J0H61_09325 [Alphaproteobacteria bacterium]|jgi:hypothetical protein|nr:hypothetical protein [Alphaproteobacteria bacterium]
MKLRLAAALIAAFALSACSDADWSQTMNSVGLGDSGEAEPVADTAPAATPAQVAPAQTAQAEPNNAFCLAVARQDSERNAFDAETQQGVFTRSYRQCLTIFGAGTPQ